ncbi:hypothetical protein [Streptomyces pilosus]|uniref:hypothetical protein n=1 Tax=Streptomyces pilosus TaxID=28893 RepID=UPI00363D928D
MTAPIAYTVHDGHGIPPTWRRKLIAAWLTANDVNPDLVSAAHPVSVLTVPFRPADTAGDGKPWLIQVIVLHQYYARADGVKEQNLITRAPVTFQRTVPLKVPFPADPTADEGTTRGEAEGQAAQEAPEVRLRPARQTQVPHTGQGPREERTVQGSSERIEGNPEEDPRQGHPEVPQPQKDRWQATQEEGVTG